MTEREAAELYNHLLARLRELAATELIREIEVTVGRGELRSEVDAKSNALQTPLSPHEAVVVALQMLVSAVETPIHRAEVEKAVESTISWRFDELEPREVQPDSGIARSPEARSTSREAPEFPSLRKDQLETLCSYATRVLELTRDTEKEIDGANAH